MLRNVRLILQYAEVKTHSYLWCWPRQVFVIIFLHNSCEHACKLVFILDELNIWCKKRIFSIYWVIILSGKDLCESVNQFMEHTHINNKFTNGIHVYFCYHSQWIFLMVKENPQKNQCSFGYFLKKKGVGRISRRYCKVMLPYLHYSWL